MGKKLKKGQVGESTQYISRARAIKKLQINLKDFRRLCILKGVYPREPTKKLQKLKKTYYHVKDIKYLMHEKLLKTFLEMRAHRKKIQIAKARKNKQKWLNLIRNKPNYNCNHLIAERYHTFQDALRDLDDPLCLIALYSSLYVSKDHDVQAKQIKVCQDLINSFMIYVAKSQTLRKVFLSIKGIYYQAQIDNQLVTWIQPYDLPHSLPGEIDYRVMSTFLEFYTTLMKFVNFKLYQQLDIKYPFSINESNIFATEVVTINNEQEKIESKKYEINQEFVQEQDEMQPPNKVFFKDCVFWLSSETFIKSLAFIIQSFGGQAYWEGDSTDVKQDDPSITHFITDRQNIKVNKGIDYVQPQWVYDSINFMKKFPISEYAPGKTLPPHLSPFTQKDDYVPDRQKEIDGDQEDVQSIEEEEEVEEEKQQEEEVTDLKIKKQIKEKQQKKQKEEELKLREKALPNKDAKLYKIIKEKEAEKKIKNQKLKNKAKQLRKN